MQRVATLMVLLCVFAGCSSDDPVVSADGVEMLTYEVVETFPHDPTAFTQGLVAADDTHLWESVGRSGESEARLVELASGEATVRADLDDEYFGEGLASTGEYLIQLTWTAGVAFVRDPTDLTEVGQLGYEGEGWGITLDVDSDELLMSDGSSVIVRRDPATFDVIGEFDVTLDGTPVDQLNELEWVAGSLYANVWRTDRIMRIDPETGNVTAVIDAAGLFGDGPRTDEMTLNGIAHRPSDPPDRLVLTGKLWPEVFVVDLVPR